MRLVDLRPRWVTDRSGRPRMGLSFDCPHCLQTRLVVMFSNPVDGGPPSEDAGKHWRREGESFETLSLDPSVNAEDGIGHWHGDVVRGEMLKAVQRPR